MKLALIAMSGVRVKNDELRALGVTLPGFVERGKVIASLPSLGLLTLAALTPDDVEVDYVEVSDLGEACLPDADLVAISSYTAQIDEAYALADRVRAAGTPVVLGGLHVTVMPHEAAAHADAIVVGEGEPVWARLIADFRAGRLRPVYRAGLYDLRQAPVPRFDLLDLSRYNRLTIQTQRGCPHACEFCGASRLFGRYRQKTVGQVVRELDAVAALWPAPFIELADDNTFVDRARARDLARAMIPYRLKWFTETDVSVADDPTLLDLLAASGCRQLLIGFESASAAALAGLDARDWKLRTLPRYARAIERIQSRGISVNGCFILGLDGDGPGVFDDVERFVEATGLADVQVTVQTPLPGTPLIERLRREGRLLADRFWDACTLFDVTYCPARMSVRELEEGMMELFRRLYSHEAVRGRRRRFVRMRAA